METTEKEIERVRLIHSCLDAWQSVVETSPRDTFTASMPDGSAVMFTRAEVREWPKLKARLVAELLKHPEWLYATPLPGGMTLAGGIIESSGISWGKKHRGRVMWRSMLPASPAQEAPAKWVPALEVPPQVLPAGTHVKGISGKTWTLLKPASVSHGEYSALNSTEPDWARRDEDGNLRRANDYIAFSAIAQLAPSAPSESAAKQDSSPAREVLFTDGTGGAGRLSERKKVARKWDRDVVGNGLDAATYQQLSTLDKRIAVARAELDQPSSERRARVSRFDPTPWQDWPKGCERNEP